MNPKQASTLLAAGSLAFASVSAIRWRNAIPTLSPRAVSSAPTHARDAVVPIDGDSLPEFVDFIVTNDPFRLSNTPATIRFDLGVESGQANGGVATPPSPRPTLVLKAIVGGPPWQALIDGIPGLPPGSRAS